MTIVAIFANLSISDWASTESRMAFGTIVDSEDTGGGQ